MSTFQNAYAHTQINAHTVGHMVRTNAFSVPKQTRNQQQQPNSPSLVLFVCRHSIAKTTDISFDGIFPCLTPIVYNGTPFSRIPVDRQQLLANISTQCLTHIYQHYEPFDLVRPFEIYAHNHTQQRIIHTIQENPGSTKNLRIISLVIGECIQQLFYYSFYAVIFRAF